jgi:hypothetical protein
MVGHSALRRVVMGEDAVGGTATGFTSGSRYREKPSLS